MYGVLRTAGCGLSASEWHAWRGHLCGLCLDLRDKFGQPARMATNSDSALIVALCEGQSENPFPKRNSFCLLHRPFSELVDDPAHPAVKYAGGTAMLIAANKIRDNLQDDPGWLRGFRRSARMLAERWRNVAEDCLATLGFEASLIERQFVRQVELEAVKGGNFFEYSQPTEIAVGTVFAHTAVLQGKPHNYEPLFEIGRSYGRIMFLLDAYQDYEQDGRSGHFNALAATYPGLGWQQPAQSLFNQAYNQLREAFSALDLPNASLLHSLLLHQLRRVGSHSLGLCHASGAGSQPNLPGSPLPDTLADSAHLFDELPGNGGGKPRRIRHPSSDNHAWWDSYNCYCCTDCCGRSTCHEGCCCDYSNCDNNPCRCAGGLSGCSNCVDCSNCDCTNCCDSSHCDCSSCCDCSNCDCLNSCDCSSCDCSGCGDCGSCDCCCSP